MGKLKLKEALLYNKLKNSENKKQSAQSQQPKPKQSKKIQQEIRDEESEEEDDDEESEDSEEEIALKKPDHPLSKKELRKLKKDLKSKGLSLEDLEDEQDQEDDDDQEDDEDQEDSDEEEETTFIDTKKLIESDSESESEFEECANKIERPKRSKKSKNDDEDVNKDDEDKNGDEEDEDVELEDAEFDDDADVIPYQKLTVNNKAALQQSLHSIELPKKGLKFVEHLSVTSSFAQAAEVKDVFDDYARELSFVKQAKEAIELARAQLKRDGVPFSRPTDYFAEMVKSDEHMDKIKQKMIDEETDKRARGDARRQRELKKFGKKVQNAKLQERQKDKRDTLEKIQSLKRKRAGNEMTAEDFDIAVEEATAASSEHQGGNRRGGKNGKRQAKDQKYGFGGKKKFKKSNDAQSSGDMSDYNRRVKANKAARQGGAKPKRPGKSKRQQRR